MHTPEDMQHVSVLVAYDNITQWLLAARLTVLKNNTILASVFVLRLKVSEKLNNLHVSQQEHHCLVILAIG